MLQGYRRLRNHPVHKVASQRPLVVRAKSVFAHKNHLVDGFTAQYNVDKLVYYEVHEEMKEAITREKQIKGWVRKKKLLLIKSANPEWKDLYDELA